jgi:hypothetical protein
MPGRVRASLLIALVLALTLQTGMSDRRHFAWAQDSSSDQAPAASEGDSGEGEGGDAAPAPDAAGDQQNGEQQEGDQQGSDQPNVAGTGLTDPSVIIARPAGAVVVPDKFLRRWDPITFFFDKDTGPAAGGAEDHPEKYVSIAPDHPGAATWLNARTLQFRPATPWPPLTRFTLTEGKHVSVLATLMSAPSATIPANNATGLDPVKAISLTLAEPLEAVELAKLVTIELRPLPGIDNEHARMLTADDFDVKAMERKDRNAPAQYVINLHDPIPGGTRALVHLRLSTEANLADGFQDIVFSTAEAFHITQLGCSTARFPIPPKGAQYDRQQAITCPAGDRAITVQFSANLQPVGPIAARNFIRITPAVDDLAYATVNNVLSVTGRFTAGTLYQIRLEPSAISDAQGHALQMAAASEAFLSFAERNSFLTWRTGAGIVERFGPQMLPLEGRGFDQVDLRIHKIDPLDRSFWPFAGNPVVVDDAKQPPAPGERPVPFDDANRSISAAELSQQIKALGSPSISDLVKLPLKKGGAAAKFGIDLQAYLERISGAKAPGTYLVGMRQLNSSTQRYWVRVQVTDLSLSAIDEADKVHFVVTSLSTGAPVVGAKVVLEGSKNGNWVEVASGTTGGDGGFDYQAPGAPTSSEDEINLKRFVVTKDNDILVLDPSRGPDIYADNNWRAASQTWLEWTQATLKGRSEPDRDLVHLFTERPIYRPEEPVHIKGYVRSYHAGELARAQYPATLVITGPDQTEWRRDVTINANGSFYNLFDEKTTATGIYKAVLELKTATGTETLGGVSFKKEAYRLPTFEVRLSGPDQTGSDKPFQVKLAATYYAGGVVADRPIHWRVTQFPYDYAPSHKDGYFYSTDARFSGASEFKSSPVMEREARTDAQGGGVLDLDPGVEPTAQPRSYVIEATVTGDDDQTVTYTKQVVSLPPFAIGVKMPRYLDKAVAIEPEILLEGPDGKALAGQDVTVQLLKRRWVSQLQASDFSQGAAKYVTETIDEPVSETPLTSKAEAQKLNLKLNGAGVYILRVEGRDGLGRSESVSVDFFADGGTPVTWSRPPAQVFKVTTEQPAYAPGETAVFILESPFQSAEALAIVEQPDGTNHYEWVPVRNGVGRFKLPIESRFMPRLPVHFLLMRGRLPGVTPSADQLDLGRPQTLAATNWLVVKPVKNLVNIKLEYPDKALPGQELNMKITLTDDTGQPLAGEVTLWMVDQAVLALAEEQRLDPLPDFIVDRATRMQLRDTRNLALGAMPLEENPGGDQGEAEKKNLLDNVTVRKNFTPVPYFNPDIDVGPSGVAEVKIKLADSLSVFKIRAKAVSGDARFGFAVGSLRVRLPVMVQPALPRFVRPGDSFMLAAIGRIIEGDGGKGKAEIKLDGLDLTGSNTADIDWATDKPAKLGFPVTVPTPGYTPEGALSRSNVSVTLGVERSADQARDAFQIDLPIRPDRQPVVRRELVDIKDGQPATLPAITEALRPGTLRRNLLVSSQPALLRMSSALNYLQAYPYGCTEQRISNARAELALRNFNDTLMLGGALNRLDRDVAETMDYIAKATSENGLVSFWPGSRPYVFLTAWSVQFLVEAREAGYTVKADQLDKLTAALKQSLRSDYSDFISGTEYAERIWALTALAEAGQIDNAYAAELANRSQFLDLESLAEVTHALGESPVTDKATLSDLSGKLWKGIVTRLYQGQEIYGGLQSNALAGNGLILPSETRTLAQVLRATTKVSAAATNNADLPKQQLLVNALVTLGRGDGWGTTNANAEALMALASFIGSQPGTAPQQAISVTLDGNAKELQVGAAHPMLRIDNPGQSKVEIALSGTGKLPLALLSDVSYLPVADGSTVATHAEGLVISRESLKIQQDDVPPVKLALDQPGKQIDLKVGDVVEDHVELVNPADHYHVAVVIPLAAGMEPLNPALATAPPEAKPLGETTLAPSYVAFLDDQVAYFYDELPKGTYQFSFRTRAQIPGQFIQPAAYGELMYDGSVNGNSNGARVVITPAPQN